jgi:hypothetical protein
MIESIVFPNYGFLKIQLTDEQVAPILQKVEKIQTDFTAATISRSDSKRIRTN